MMLGARWTILALGQGMRLGGVAALLALPLAAGPSATRLSSAIVVTQVPRESRARHAPQSPSLVRSRSFAGARLLLLPPEGQPQVLSAGFHSACDPNVSFDAQRLLFAGKKDPAAGWRIWELSLDGQHLRAVSPEHLDARSPIHVSTLFTLDSPEPWLNLLFVARESTLNELGQPAASSLYSLKLDGTELRRLTFNPNLNVDPFQMWDGRILYAAERYPSAVNAAAGHVGLFAVHLEGADMEFYGGERGRRIQRMPCATADGLVVVVESDQPTWDGAGQLAAFEQRRPHVTYRPLTRDPAHLFLYPTPLSGSRLLVSRRAANGKGTAGIVCVDTRQGSCEPVFDSPDFDELQAVVVAPRQAPDGHSTVVDTQSNAGVIYGLNSYDADPQMAPHLAPGTIKHVRFIEGVLRSATDAKPPGLVPEPAVPRRLVGEAPVEPDGSFNVEVPADVPLLVQTLDEHGLALATCGWIWVKPKENRGCIGCHEDPERVPENQYVLALRRPSNRLVLPPEARRTVVFDRDIVPILQRACATADCHGGHDTPLHLPLQAAQPSERDRQQAYANLLKPGATAPRKSRKATATTASGKYVDAGRARTSWLVWQLIGHDTSRPWDESPSAQRPKLPKITAMPPPGKGAPLSREALRTLIQWIDLGAPYTGPRVPLTSPSATTP